VSKVTYNLSVPIEYANGTKTFWHNIGTLWLDGDKLSMKFNSLPLPNKDGEVWVRGFVKDDEKPQQRRAAEPKQQRSVREEIDDDIPF